PLISSTRGSFGSPCTVISRKVALSFLVHFAVSNPGTLTQGVSTVAPDAHGFTGIVLVIVLPVASRYAWRSPLPPPSAAGFTHAPSCSVSGPLPKGVFAGGGTFERNDE